MLFCDWSDNFFKKREEISGLINMKERIRRARGTTTGRVTRKLRVISCVLQPSCTLFIHYIRRKITFCLKCFTIVAVFFSGFFTQLHKLRSLRRSFLHFHLISAVHILFISYIINTFEGAFTSGGRLIIFSFTGRWAYNWWPL